MVAKIVALPEFSHKVLTKNGNTVAKKVKSLLFSGFLCNFREFQLQESSTLNQ